MKVRLLIIGLVIANATIVELPAVNEHFKCQALVIAYQRWSLTSD